MTPKWYMLIAIASGLAIAAFNKPKVYKEIYKAIIKTLLATIPIVIVWYTGFRWACSDLQPLIDPTKAKQAEAVAEQALYSIVWMIFVFICLIYLEFLSWIADKVIIHSGNEPPKDE